MSDTAAPEKTTTQTRALAHAADLLALGYQPIEQSGTFTIGQRVRHIGEQYSAAYSDGTATIEGIYQRPGTIQGMADVEIIVKRDKPKFGPDDTHGLWANYHTVAVRTGGDK